MKLRDSVFLVTGGASGLGAATVRMVVGAGGRAVVADLKEAEGHALAKELGSHARFVRCDVTDEASAQAAVRAAVDGYGGECRLFGPGDYPQFDASLARRISSARRL